MRNSIRVASAIALAMACFGTTQATELDYSYGELRFVDTEIGNLDGDGFRLSGSYELDKNWLLVGRYTTLDYDANIDASQVEIGGGYVWRYTPNFDLIGTARFIHAEVDTNFGNADDNGFALSAGGRGLLTQAVELRGSVNHVNLENSDTYLELAGDYHFSEQLSAGAGLEFGGDADSLTIGARWFFR